MGGNTLKVVKAFCLCLFFSLVTNSYAYNSVERNYDMLSKLPSSQLLDKAEQYLAAVNKQDSALLCLTIITHRYTMNLSKDEKINTISAYNGIWFIMFFTYFDYAKSFDALMKASQIAEKMGYSQAQIYLNFGCFYQTLAEECKDKTLMQKAFLSYRKSFTEGLKNIVLDQFVNSFGNLAMVSSSLHCMDEILPEWKQFEHYYSSHKNPYLQYTSYLYKGLVAKEHGDYVQALKCFKSQLPITDDKDRNYIRNRLVAYLNIADVLSCQKKYDEAASYVHQALAISTHFDLKDCKLQCYEKLAEYYSKSNRPSESDTFRDNFYQLKDTLLNYQQLASVKDIQFLSQINTLDEQITKSNFLNKVKNYIIIFGSVVVVVIIFLLLALYRRNKWLQQNNEALYTKNVEIIELEQRQKAERLEKSRLEENSKPVRYSSHPITEDAGNLLMSKIREVLDSSDEVYKADFSLNRLAQLTEEQPKRVSQIINQLTGDNFNALINEYRIKEACKRINDKANYGNLTLEGIALSVGFKSTNTFRAAFKRVTGLYPSKYLQLARR